MNPSPKPPQDRNGLRFLASPVVGWCALFFLFFLFAFFQLVRPESPGMVYNGWTSAFFYELFTAEDLLRSLRERSLWDLFIRGDLPVERDHYHGRILVYLYLPWLVLTGWKWSLIKHMAFLWAIPTLIFTYLFVRNLFGRRAALLTLLLLTIHPTYVLGVRFGAALISPMQFFSTGALCCLSYWWTTRRRTWFFGAMFFLGLGMSSYIWFYWLIAGLLIAALKYRRDLAEHFAVRESGRMSQLAGVGFLGFIAGAVTIVYREFQQPFESVKALFRSDSTYSATGWNHLRNLIESTAANCHSLLESRFFQSFTSDLFFRADHLLPMSFLTDFPFKNSLYPWMIIVSSIFLLTKRPRELLGKAAAIPPILLWTIVILSVTRAHYGPEVFVFFMYPLPQITAAAAFVAADRLLLPRPGMVMRVAVLAVVLVECLTLGKYISRFLSLRDTIFYTDTIYQVAGWLKAEGFVDDPSITLAADPETAAHLYFILPSRRVRAVLPHPMEDSIVECHPSFYIDHDFFEKAGQDVRRYNGEREMIFVSGVSYPVFLDVLKAPFARRHGLEMESIRNFSGSRGELVFKAYRLRKKPASA